jgi:hypothetical protein
MPGSNRLVVPAFERWKLRRPMRLPLADHAAGRRLSVPMPGEVRVVIC